MALRVVWWLLVTGLATASVVPTRADPTNAGEVTALPRLTVVVLPFNNLSGDAAIDEWGEALPSLVRMCLEGAPYTRTLRPQATESAVQRLEEGGVMAVDAALELARDTRANAIVWGGYRRLGDGWAADVNLLRLGEQAALAQIQVNASGWVDLAESLAVQLAERLNRCISSEERRVWRRTAPSSETGAARFARAIDLEFQEAPAAEQEAAWRAVLIDDPQCGIAHGSLMKLLSLSQRESECCEAAEAFLRQQPESCEAHAMYAWILARKGETAGAEAAVKTALRLHPGCRAAIEALVAIVLSNQECWKRLTSVLEETLAARPDADAARVVLAIMRAERGRLEEAHDLLEAMEDLPKESTLIDVCLLKAALAVGRLDLAGLELQRLGPQTATNAELASIIDSTWVTVRPHPLVLPPREWTSEELRAELDLVLTPEERELAVNPLEIKPELVAEATRLTAGLTNDALRSLAIFADVTRRRPEPGDGERRGAGPALRDLRHNRLNCHERAKLFVILTRAVGLKSWLVHVDLCADGLPGYHDCAALLLDGHGLLVDPASGAFGIGHRQLTVLDDLQAISHQAMQPSPEHELQLLRLGLKLNPEDRWTRLQFVRGMARAGELELADEVLRQVRAGGPEHWETHEAAAEVAAARKQWIPALTELGRALELSPSNAMVHLKVSAVHGELNDPTKALQHLERALALNRGEISAELGREWRYGLQFMAAISEAQTDSGLQNLRRRAEAGELAAQMALAGASFEAQPPRADEGMRWLKLAAEQDDPQAQFNYYDNLILLGGQSAAAEAVPWLIRSAEQGYDQAQYQLGLVLYEGNLVPRDDLTGAYWVYLAADQGHVEARRLLRELHIMLEPAEMAEARRRADAFVPVKRGTTHTHLSSNPAVPMSK